MPRKRRHKRTGFSTQESGQGPAQSRPSPASESIHSPALESRRGLDFKAMAKAAIASPEFAALPAGIQAALTSEDPAENKKGLRAFARRNAIQSPHFGELPPGAQAAIRDELDTMPSALVLLNEIRLRKTSPGGELLASWAPVSEEVAPEPSAEETYEVVAPPQPPASELALVTPERPPKRKWKSAQELRISPEEIVAQLDEADAQHAAKNFSTLPALPEAPTSEQAIAWLEDILARRRVTPKPGVPYRIPDLLPDDHGFATGSSIIEGDALVSFPIVEVRQGESMVIFGPQGSKYGKDMPFVSEQLKHSVIKALRYLPGYTELCEVTGKPMSQPLVPIAHKLLRGEIRRWQDIHFTTKSKEAIEEEKRQRIAENDARLAAGKERKSKLLNKLAILLSVDPRIPEVVARLHARSRPSPESAASPWSVSIPDEVISAHATALREGKDPGPAGALSSLLNAD